MLIKSYLLDVDPQDSTDTPRFKILENTLEWIYPLHSCQRLFFFCFQMTVNLKKLRTLTLRMCKRFRCKQCCCSVVQILKLHGLIRLATQGRGRYSTVQIWCVFYLYIATPLITEKAAVVITVNISIYAFVYRVYDAPYL